MFIYTQLANFVSTYLCWTWLVKLYCTYIYKRLLLLAATCARSLLVPHTLHYTGYHQWTLPISVGLSS